MILNFLHRNSFIMFALLCFKSLHEKTGADNETITVNNVISGCSVYQVINDIKFYALTDNRPICLAVTNAFVLGDHLHMIAAFYNDKKYTATKETTDFLGVSTACPDESCTYVNKTLIKVWTTADYEVTAGIYIVEQSTTVKTTITDPDTNFTFNEETENRNYYSTAINNSLEMKYSKLFHRESESTFKVTTHHTSLTLLGCFNHTAKFEKNTGLIYQSHNNQTNGTTEFTTKEGAFPRGLYAYYSLKFPTNPDLSSIKIKGAFLEEATAKIKWTKPSDFTVYAPFHGMIPAESKIFKKADLAEPSFPIAAIGIIIALIVVIGVVVTIVVLIYCGVGPCLKICPYFGSYKNLNVEIEQSKAQGTYLKVVD